MSNTTLRFGKTSRKVVTIVFEVAITFDSDDLHVALCYGALPSHCKLPQWEISDWQNASIFHGDGYKTLKIDDN